MPSSRSWATEVTRSPGSSPLVDLDLGVDLARFGLTSTPFSAGTGPRVLWRGQAQRDLLARFRAGVIGNAGILLLLGDVGTGKLFSPRHSCRGSGATTLIGGGAASGTGPAGLPEQIGGAWGLDGRSGCREDFYDRLEPFLAAAASRNKRVLLMVDEVQRLSPESARRDPTLWRAFRETLAPPALNILLVGQEEASALLSRPENATRKRKSPSLASLNRSRWPRSRRTSSII